MSGRGTQSTYDELVTVLADLPVLVRGNRRRLGQSVREAAAELGVSPSTVSRIERGEEFNSGVLAPLLAWLGKR